MTDIVTELRVWAKQDSALLPPSRHIASVAADEIDRLRADQLGHDQCHKELLEAEAEVTKLRAEIERLRHQVASHAADFNVVHGVYTEELEENDRLRSALDSRDRALGYVPVEELKPSYDELRGLLTEARGWIFKGSGEEDIIERIDAALSGDTNTDANRLAETHKRGLCDLCAAQAEDEALWCQAQTPMEAMLQTALRDLHHAVEGTGDTASA